MAVETGAALSAAQLQAVRAEALRQYAQTAPRIAAAGFLFALLVAWLQRSVVTTGHLAAWLVVMALALSLRLALGLIHRARGTPETPALPWLWAYRLSVLGTAIAWGLSAQWLFPDAHPQHQAYLFVALLAVAIAGSSMLANDAVAAVLFALPAIVPVAARLALAGGETTFIWGAAAFVPFQLWTSLRNHASMRESALLRQAEHERATRATARLETLLVDVAQRMRFGSPAGQGASAGAAAEPLPTTELAAAAAELVEQNHLLSELVRTTREGIWFIDNEGRTTDLNPAMCALLGRERESVIGRTIFDFVDAGNAAIFRRELQRRRAGERSGYELALLRPDGTLVHCLNNATPLEDLDGRRVGSVGLWTDVSELKRSEVRLRDYEFAINAMPDTVSLMVRRDGRFAYQMVNDAWCRLTGLTREQVMGGNLDQASGVRVPDIGERRRLLAEAAETRRSITHRGPVIFGGRALTVQTVYHPIIEGDGPAQRMIVVTRDVSEEERAQAAVTASLENLRMALNAIGDGVFASGATSPDEPVLFHNERVLQLWGLKLAAGAALTPRAIMAHAATQLAEPEVQRQRVAEIVRENLASDDRVPMKDGRVLRRRSYPFVSGGRVVRVWTLADVTAEERTLAALRAAEARHRSMVEAFPGFIAGMDADLRFDFVNGRVLQLMGLGEHEVIGRRIGDLEDTEGSRATQAAARRALQGETVVVERHWPARPGRPEQFHLITLSPGPAHANAKTCYAFGIDISSLKQAQAQLLVLKEEAERANLAKSEFLSRMSHELRTPMNAVIGFAQVLQADRDPPLHPAHQAYVSEITAGGLHLLELINEVLDLARVESGRLEVSLEPVELMPLMSECSGLVAALARSHDVTQLATEGPAGAVWVRGDRIRLKQVLLNLLSNAMKYNRRGGEVRTTVRARDQGWQIEVRDQGEGLTGEQQQRLFVPFERLDAEHRGAAGTGIGLALCRKLMELMGGRIGMSSEPGKGCCFWVWLPAAPPARAAAAAAPVDPAPARRDPAEERPLEGTVLYVERSDFDVELMRAALHGFPALQVQVAQGADDCMAQAGEQPPALILVNLELPDLDAAELVRRLREHPRTRETPVVALCGDPAEAARRASESFDAALGRPFDLATLAAALRRAMAAAERGRSHGPA